MRRFQLAWLGAISALFSWAPADAQDLPDGPGKAVVQHACLQCHGVNVIARQPRSRDDWMAVAAVMIGRGVQLNDDEYDQVIDYLATRLGPSGPGFPLKGHPTAPAPTGDHGR